MREQAFVHNAGLTERKLPEMFLSKITRHDKSAFAKPQQSLRQPVQLLTVPKTPWLARMKAFFKEKVFSISKQIITH